MIDITRGKAEPNYRVWRPDVGETDDDGTDYGAFDECSAAEHHAMFCHNQRSGWEWSWPVTFRVLVLATGRLFDVEVDRHTVPEFEAGRPKEIACP